MNLVKQMNYKRLILISQEIKQILSKHKSDLNAIIKAFENIKEFSTRLVGENWVNPVLYIDYKSYDGHKYSIAFTRKDKNYEMCSLLSRIDDKLCSLDYAEKQLVS